MIRLWFLAAAGVLFASSAAYEHVDGYAGSPMESVTAGLLAGLVVTPFALTLRKVLAKRRGDTVDSDT